MLSDPVGVARGYEQYFGLVESPFGLTPNRRFLFKSESHTEAFEQVTLAIRRREPLVVITGEIGTGKTLLCRTIQAVEPRTFVSVISNPRTSARDLLLQVLHDFGLVSDESPGSDDTTEHEFVRTLQQFLSSLASLGAHAVIVIDEAHRLGLDTLEQVRLLCSLEAGRQELLQVILVGRLDLEAMLERPELHLLAQRVSRRHQLQPLKAHEIATYIESRVTVAQGDPGLASSRQAADALVIARFRRVRFTPVALRALPPLTQGLPRAVNIICDRALEIAFSQKKRVVDAGCVLAAARDLKVVIPFELHLRSRWRFGVPAALLLAAGAGVFALGVSDGFTWTRATMREPSLLIRDTAESPVEETAAVAPLPEAQGYLVAADSFRSASRAAEVVSSLRLLDLPVFVRRVDGSHAVVVGPFASREEAVEAQAQIARVHLSNSQIVPTAPTEGAIVHPPRPVAMSGQRGQP